jgi:hypothetical protein
MHQHWIGNWITNHMEESFRENLWKHNFSNTKYYTNSKLAFSSIDYYCLISR